MRSFNGILAIALIATLGWHIGAAAQGRPVRTVKEGILDEIKLYADKLPSSTRVVIKPFSATDDDVEGDSEETKKMKVDGPGMLADQFVLKLKELGPFTDVSAVTQDAAPAADALLVEGKFTEIDPGSRAKRYFVGFGAGKSGVTVQGSVKGADGKLLAAFEQRRVGVMGVAGGNSMDKLTSDTRDIAEDIAKFLSAWAKGDKLN
jgi:Domain of unknown function (DUF4410)